jgi:bacterioferritin-associated ferredoxin
VTDALLSLLPAWDRLTAPEHHRLLVEPLRRVEIDELVIHDDDLPQLDGATVIWAWREASADGERFVVRAARIEERRATPYLVRAARLRVQRPDPSLARLLAIDPADPPASVHWSGHPRHMERPPRHIACICRLTSSERVYQAIHDGWHSVDEVKRATEAGFGQCQGRRCVALLAHKLDLETDEPRGNITSRPPLVPVPASVLAAFAGDEPAAGA